MSGKQLIYSQPRMSLLRWLIDPCLDVSPRIADDLRDGLFASPWTLLIATLNGLVVNTVALAVGGGQIFAWLIVIDISLVLLRMLIFGRLHRGALTGSPTPTDLYLMSCIAWCAAQGVMAFCAMRTDIASLQVICAMTVAGLMGPICMRNFGTPRFAFALAGLSLGPLVCGAVMSRDPWLSVLALQAPAVLFGAARMLGRLQALTVSNLQAEQASQERARRDSLTGLLNRAGLAEASGEIDASSAGSMVCLYLDLDGFKTINDVHGHQVGDELLKMVAIRLSSIVGDFGRGRAPRRRRVRDPGTGALARTRPYPGGADLARSRRRTLSGQRIAGAAARHQRWSGLRPRRRAGTCRLGPKGRCGTLRREIRWQEHASAVMRRADAQAAASAR